MMRLSLLHVPVLLSVCCAPAFAWARSASSEPAESATDQDASTGVAEIIVTARNRRESMMNVPVAVSALNQAALANGEIKDLREIGKAVPQLVIGEATSGSAATIVIRGIGSAPQDPGFEQTVVVNVDGISFSRGRIVRQGFFDLAQVEVLKGPQSLFFGKNSVAGVVVLTSADPGKEFGGYVRGSYEIEAREKVLEGAINVPVSEDFGLRFAGHASWMDGWIRNLARPQANPFPGGAEFSFPGASDTREPHNREQIGRFTAAYDPAGGFDAKLKVQVGRYRSSSATAAAQVICGPGQTFPTVGGFNDVTGDCKIDSRRSVTAIPAGLIANWDGGSAENYSRQTSVLTSLAMNYQTGPVTFTSITGYVRLKNNSFDNFSYAAIAPVFANEYERTRQFTQELRATTDFEFPLNFTAGAYYEHGKREYGVSSISAILPDPATGRFFTFDRYANQANDAYSIYAQARWKVVPTVELAGGARWTKEEKHTKMANLYVNPGRVTAFLPQGQVLEGDFSDSRPSVELTASWQPTPEHLIYGAFKTGYKSGGFSASTLVAGLTIDTMQFKSETVRGVEAGYKGTLLDNQLRVQLAAYHYRYRNQQQSAYNPITTGFTVVNASSSVVKGLEGSLEWLPTSELSFKADAGYNHASFKSFPGAPCYIGQTETEGCMTIGAARAQDNSGRSLVRAPRFVSQISGTYTTSVSYERDLSISAGATYTSKFFTSETFNPVGVQDSYWLVNASIRLSPSNGQGWEAALIGQNLTNKYYYNVTFDRPVPNEQTAVSVRPRQIALQLGYKF